jgi:uncharacterized damage-inducible protein DinB
MAELQVPPALATLFGDLPHELANTRRVLDRVDTAKIDYKPHAKSHSLGQLASHVAQLVAFHTAVLTSDELDINRPRAHTGPLTSREAILEEFDRNVEALNAALQNVKPEDLGKQWTFRAGDHVIFTLTKAAAVRSFCMSHSIHHRGQLTVYLRLLGIPMPGMYGPSADER